jgi:energy-coupling factor transporter transmembrane protein EcfT
MTDRIIAFSILCLVFGLPLGVAALFTGELILDFVFFWPLFMSVLWITGGLYFWFQLERHWSWDKETPAPTLAGEPLISILIPCFNEEEMPGRPSAPRWISGMKISKLSPSTTARLTTPRRCCRRWRRNSRACG